MKLFLLLLKLYFDAYENAGVKKSQIHPHASGNVSFKVEGKPTKNWVEKIMKAFLSVDDLIPEVSVPD